MKKIRFTIRLLSLFLIRYRFLVILGFLLGIFFFFFLPQLSGFIPKRKPTETIGIVGRFRPSEIPLEIQNLISFGLTKLDQDGTSTPGIANDWKVEEGSKVYTFFLRDNLFWHDGSKVTASDINYNFQDVSVEILDPKTIRFRLKEPFSPLPEVVSRPVFKKGLVGVGPYKVKKITKTGQFVEAISLDSLSREKPNLKYRFYPTEETGKIALKLGEVRKLVDLTNPNGFTNWKNIKVFSRVRQDRFVGIFLNTQKPYLEEKNFRQALAYTTKKEQGKTRAYGPLSPLSWAYSEDVKAYNYDLENAKRLLNKVLEKKEKKEITIRLSTVPSLLSEAEKIKNSWQDLGVKVEIGAFTQLGEDFDILLATQEIPKDPDQYSLWHSTQTGNITQFKNPRIDKLLEDGRKTQNREEREKIYFDFQRFLVEEVPVIFLYHPTTYEISRK
ncbi:MAG: ABC transporter substrate-binding protein [Patescibacteria group bacterium]